MPKKRHSILHHSKPSTTAHPSLSSSSSRHQQQDGGGASSTVNEKLQRLRKEQQQSSRSAAAVGGGGGAGITTSTTPNATPGPIQPLHAQYVIGSHPAARALETPFGNRARRGTNGRRPPPGPAAPASWSGENSGAADQERDTRKAPHELAWRTVTPLPGMRLPARRSLVAMALRALAKQWQFHMDYDRYWLPCLPARYKALLLHYLARFQPRTVDTDALEVLFASEESDGIEGATGADDVKHLDLATAIGGRLGIRQLARFFAVETSVSDSPPCSQPPADPVIPDSWDRPLETLSMPTPRFQHVTDLSLAHPTFTSTLWQKFMAAACHFGGLTHLSLAFWPSPSLMPKTSSDYTEWPTGELHYAPAHMGADHLEHETASVMKRLGKLLLCLRWLDLTGCWPWITCLGSEKIDWTTSWAALEEIKADLGWEAEIREQLHRTFERLPLIPYEDGQFDRMHRYCCPENSQPTYLYGNYQPERENELIELRGKRFMCTYRSLKQLERNINQNIKAQIPESQRQRGGRVRHGDEYWPEDNSSNAIENSPHGDRTERRTRPSNIKLDFWNIDPRVLFTVQPTA